MKISKETARILAEISTSNTGINRFLVNASNLNGPAFAMSLKSLAFFENQLDGNLFSVMNERVSGNKIDPELIQFYGSNLVEIKFCMGLFSIAYSDPTHFDFNEDTTGWDIYLDLEAKKESLPPRARERFNIASSAMHKGDTLKRITDSLRTVNHVITSGCMYVGRQVSKAIDKTPDVLNKFAKWLDRKTTEKAQ